MNPTMRWIQKAIGDTPHKKSIFRPSLMPLMGG